MDLTVIDNHSVYEPALVGFPILDVGCRGFRFAKHERFKRHVVHAMDPAPDIAEPGGNVVFHRKGLAAQAGMYWLTDLEDKEANRLTRERGTHVHPEAVEAITIQDLMSKNQILKWDLVKLNCEGAEFDILHHWPGPLSRQIVVSFHEHTPEKRGEAAINALVGRLGQWYDVLRHEWDERYCAGRNAWDTVLLLRGIL